MSTPRIIGQYTGDITRLVEIEQTLTNLLIEAKVLVSPDEFEQLKYYWAALIMVS